MLVDFNLIATSDRGSESEACSELWMLLRAKGDRTPVVDRSSVRGLILARTSLSPTEAVILLKDELRSNPDSFRVLLRVLPVEVVIPTELETIADTSCAMASKIGVNESFRITVEKRRTELRRKEIIDSIAIGIERKVDLKHYDWNLLIEIIGRWTGVSVVRPETVLNVQKERAELLTD